MSEVDLPTASRLMTKPSLVLAPAIDIFDAIDSLIAKGIAAAPVVDGDGHLLGMLTEKDCLRVLSTAAYESQPGTATVATYQSPIPWFCEPGMDFFRVAEIFLQNNFPVLPVVEGGKLVGVINRAAVLRGIQGLHQEMEAAQRLVNQQTSQLKSRPSSIEDMQRLAAKSTPGQMARLMRR